MFVLFATNLKLHNCIFFSLGGSEISFMLSDNLIQHCRITKLGE